MIGLLDCGTSNTKFYLLDEQAIVWEEYESQGIKDFGGHPDKSLFKRMIGTVIQRALERAGKTLDALDKVVAFGMITSEIGLIELPHQVAPADAADLHRSLYIMEQQDIVPAPISFVFIRGVRLEHGDMNQIKNVLNCDFMRGEETQSLGIAALYPTALPMNVLFLSSHTKLVYVNRAGQIEKSITTLSGQLFAALCHHTILEKSLACTDETAPSSALLKKMYTLAKTCLDQDGFLRALLIPRFMEVFTARTALERRVFLEAAIAIEDCHAFDRYFENGRYRTTHYFILGQELRSRLYELALRELLGNEIVVTRLVGRDAVKTVTIAGSTQILNANTEEEATCVIK